MQNMKILLNKSELALMPARLIQRAGYHEHRDHRSSEVSYARRFTPNIFPKFHVYLTDRGATVEISLHLDQKQPSYGVGHMHSGDYEGPLVEKEMERIKHVFLTEKNHPNEDEYH